MYHSFFAPWELSASSLCYNPLSRYIAQHCFVHGISNIYLSLPQWSISSLCKHGWQSIAAGCARHWSCSGKRCKADGLVKRGAHGRLCMTIAPCYLMLPWAFMQKDESRKWCLPCACLVSTVHFVLVNINPSLHSALSFCNPNLTMLCQFTCVHLIQTCVSSTPYMLVTTTLRGHALTNILICRHSFPLLRSLSLSSTACVQRNNVQHYNLAFKLPLSPGSM